MNFSIKNACLALGLCASTVVSANPTSWYSALFTKTHAGVTATRDNLTDPTPRYTAADLFKVGVGVSVVTFLLSRCAWAYAWKCKRERDEAIKKKIEIAGEWRIRSEQLNNEDASQKKSKAELDKKASELSAYYHNQYQGVNERLTRENCGLQEEIRSLRSNHNLGFCSNAGCWQTVTNNNHN